MLRIVVCVFLLFAGTAAAGEVEALLTAALRLACDDADAETMAGALPGGASLLADEPIAMGGTVFGWRRRFALGDGGGGGRLRLLRMAPWDQLRRVEAEYAAPAGGGVRPGMVAIAGPDCAVTAARRMVYGDDGEAVAIEILDTALEPTGVREALNPPPPTGHDPGGVTVALIDSGVNYLLPAIAARLARDAAGRTLGYDYWDLDDRPYDSNPARSPFFPQRHGTRVASVILAEAPGVRLIPYRYPRHNPERWADLIADAAAKGARIVNLAMGSNRPGDWRGFRGAVEAAADVLFVVSAGNDGRNIDRKPVYPASFDLANMLVVASADGFGKPAPGSNWGKGTVDLLVPGERIAVTDFHGNPATASGSSFAAPRVAALAARLAAAHPGWTAKRLKAAIIARARMTDVAGPLTSRYGFLDPLR